METGFSISKFKPGEMPDSPVIVAIAKRRSGKSFLIRDILYQLRKRFCGGIIQSGTEEANGFYEELGYRQPISFTISMRPR